MFALVSIVVAGCGGDSDDSAQKGDGKRETGLAQAELVRRADDICSQARIAIVAQIPKGDLGVLGALTAASVSNKVAPGYVKKLERLQPREGDAQGWNAYLDAERRLMRANSAALEGSQSRKEFLAGLAKARAPSAEARRAAAALGLKACTRGPNTRVGTAAGPAGTHLRRTGVRARVPDGWRPKRSSESATTAFASDDDEVYCAFGRSRFGAAPGGGSPKALLKYAKAQSDFVKGKSRSYRLISIQPERAANGTGVGISRELDGRAEHIAFFYRPPQRYIVLCATRTPAEFSQRDREVFRPVIRGLSMPDRP